MRIQLHTFTKQSKVYIQSLFFIGFLLIAWSCKKEDPPTLTTLPVTEVTGNTAISGGNITDDGGASVTARGVVWSTSENPTMNNKEGSTSDGIGDGVFKSNLTGLSPGTTYYLRAYAVNNAGTAYGNQEQFTTVDLASVTTAEVKDITTRTATSGGEVTDDGGAEVTARGVVWGTSQNPTAESNDGETTDGSSTGTFVSELIELNPGTTYYVRAYATNLEGTSYGEQVEFATIGDAPTATTNDASDITSTSAVLNGSVNPNKLSTNVKFEYGTTTEYGNDVEAEQSPVSGDTSTTVSADITDLSPGTTYHFRIKAENEVGVTYGDDMTFKTQAILPTVTTKEVSEITYNSTYSGGDVISDGGAEVTARGVVWSTLENPTVDSNDGKTTDDSGTGGFVSELTELNPGTTYFVRAYATNSAGTGYGEQVSFKTQEEEVITYTLALSVNPSGSGEVTGAGSYQEGEEVEINATANEGYKFVNWTGDTEYISNVDAASTTVTMPGSNVSLTANFNQEDNDGGTDTDTEVVEVTNPATGKTWMDRNLGATRAATSSTDSEAYGDLYQWGRAADGHQKRNSPTTSTLSSSDTPGHGDFITVGSSPYDWRSPQNTNLWQGVNGTNNPCPAGYRLPTEAELDAERQSWSSYNSAGAFASPLKLPVAGRRSLSSGSLDGVGSYGLYWSGTVGGTYSRVLLFSSSNARVDSGYRAYGVSVRCLKDD